MSDPVHPAPTSPVQFTAGSRTGRVLLSLSAAATVRTKTLIANLIVTRRCNLSCCTA
jgi:hypothetical protein